MRAQLRLAWIVAVAFILVGGVAVFLLERDGTPLLPAPRGAAERRETNEPEPSAPDREPATSASSVTSKATLEAEPSAREEIDEALGVDLALVDAMTRKPRDDAAAWYIDPAADEADRRKFWHQSDPLVEHCGVALDVDKEAHVRLPDLAEVEVVARAADRFGRASIRRSGGEQQRLLLWPDSPLTVRVVDAEGRRCGDLPVVLDVVDLSNEGRERSRASFLPPDFTPDFSSAGLARLLEVAQRFENAKHEGLWRGTTSKSNGEAEVPHGAMLLVEWSDPDLVARSTTLRFRLALPTTDAATALVDPQMDLHQPVVLVAPTLARLRVSVVGADDRPYPYEVKLTSRLATAGEADDQEDPSNPFATARAHVGADNRKKKPSESSSRVPPRPEPPAGIAVSKSEKPVEMLVPAGASIEIEAEPADSHFNSARTTVTAPADADGAADVSLQLTPKKNLSGAGDSPRVFGRAIDPDGRPLLDERIGWGVVDPYRWELFHRPESEVRADHRGVFVLPFPRPHGSGPVSIRLFAPCPREDSGMGPTMGARVGLGDPDRKRDLDLGDVKFERLPLILSGRVVDPEGRGLPHPQIELWAARSSVRDGTDAIVLAGRAGSFAIHGETEERSLRVAAVLDGWYMPGSTMVDNGRLILPARTVGVGTSDVVIELHRCGVARGELLLDASVEPSAIRLETLPHPPAAKVVREDGARFRLVGIPGLCDLTARGSGGCLLTLIDRIELREAASSDDPRIQPLDMTGVVRMPIRVVDPGGTPIPDASLALSSNSEGAKATRVFHADSFGREVIVAVQNDGPLLVGAAGLRLKREPLESISKTIALAPGIAVSASLKGLADVPPQVTARISARYRPARGDSPALQALLDGLTCSSAERPARDAKLDLFLSAPGTWSLIVTLADSDRKTEETVAFAPRIVTVEDARDPLHLDVQISEASLRWVLERLER